MCRHHDARKRGGFPGGGGWASHHRLSRTCRLTIVHGAVSHRLAGTAPRSASKTRGSSAFRARRSRRAGFLPPGDLGRVRQAARFLRGFGGGEVRRAERASLPAETPTARAGLAARRLPTNLQSPAKDLDDYDEMQSEGPTHLQSQAEAARASSAGCPGAQRIGLPCCDAGLRP